MYLDHVSVVSKVKNLIHICKFKKMLTILLGLCLLHLDKNNLSRTENRTFRYQIKSLNPCLTESLHKFLHS